MDDATHTTDASLPRRRPSVVGVGVLLAAAWAAAACASSAEKYAGPGGAKRLYEARCTLCHVAFAPSDFGPDEWPDIVDDMAPRAGLSRSQRARVLAYLLDPEGTEKAEIAELRKSTER